MARSCPGVDPTLRGGRARLSPRGLWRPRPGGTMARAGRERVAGVGARASLRALALARVDGLHGCDGHLECGGCGGAARRAARAHGDAGGGPTMRVRDVMSRAVLSVTATTPVAEARRLMQREQIRHLLVMDATRLEGIVTDRDIRLNLPSPATTLSVWEMNALLMKLTVGEIMTTALVTIRPDGGVDDAAELMVTHKFGALPVTEDGQVVGIVTETDLLRALIRLHGRPRCAAKACA
ncbi:MAG: hypothetical protein DME09_06965 [Candidatus Rokuibacteriota bacterium]|nr:MAG: hypothetical protein DME09_06965 [Candidatus Rokubacteria bacterium]